MDNQNDLMSRFRNGNKLGIFWSIWDVFYIIYRHLKLYMKIDAIYLFIVAMKKSPLLSTLCLYNV